MTNINNDVNIPNYNLPIGQIIESGSNDNGTYIKFSDGILIQFGRKLFISETPRTWFGTTVYSQELELTLPKEFKSGDYTTTSDVNIANMNIFAITHASPTTTSTLTLSFVCSNQNETRTIHWVAIGRWK